MGVTNFSHAVIIGESSNKVLLNAVTTTATGTEWEPVAKDKTFQVIITVGTATVIIEGSNDPLVKTAPASATWIQLRDSVTGTLISATATGGFENAFPWKYVRARVTAIAGGGVVTVILAT